VELEREGLVRDRATGLQIGGAAGQSQRTAPTRLSPGAVPDPRPGGVTLPYDATAALPSGAFAAAYGDLGSDETAALVSGAGPLPATRSLAFDATAALPSAELMAAGLPPLGGAEARTKTPPSARTITALPKQGASAPAGPGREGAAAPEPVSDDGVVIEAVSTPPASSKQAAGAEDDELLGALVAGRFRVERLLGAGGMGRVYEAEQAGLGRKVALKVLHPRMAASDVHKQRFHQEARAASRLRHPGSVGVFDFGEWQGQLFIAMELLHGQSLEELIRREAPLVPSRAMELADQIAAVLAAAHEHEVLHRDLKPGNVILHTDDRGTEHVKVVDFGLALLVNERRDKRLTTEGMVLGTPAYMSPEQFQDLPLDARSDLYSLGVLLYEMLCGKLPFSGNTSTYLLQLLYLEAPPPSEAVPGIKLPDGLEDLVVRLMAKVVAQRPNSAAEVRAELRAISERAAAGPDEAEQARRRALLLGDRAERAEAFGLPRREAAPPGARAAADDEETLAVVERVSDPTQSVTVTLRAEGYLVAQFANVETLLRESPGGWAAGVVVVLQEPAAPSLEALSAEGGVLSLGGETAVVVVGPDDSFELMTRALELGAADYLPAPEIKHSLRRSVERLLRRRRRRRAKGR